MGITDLAHPAKFRKALKIETDAGLRSFDSCLDDWQRQDFEAIDDAWRLVAGHDVTPQYQRAWLERPALPS